MRLLWLLPTLSALRFSPRKIAKPAGRLSAKVARAPWRIATQPWKVQDKFNASPSAASELYKPNAPEDDEPLTRSQFRVALDRLGIKTSPKDLRDLWRMLDADKNEAISLKEFTRFVTKEDSEEKAPKIAGELRESLRTQPAWILKNLQGTRGAGSSKIESIEEIDVIRLEYDAMRGVRADSKIVYDGSRYAATYASRDWLKILASIQKSFVARRIASPLRILSLWALTISILHRVVGSASWSAYCGASAPLKGVASAMGYVGSALSLLLVFRTNTAYTRYWEGRGVWNRLVVASRDAAEFAGLYRAELGADRVRKLGDLLCAFPLALQLHLQGQPLRADPSADLRRVFRSIQRRGGVDPDKSSRVPLDAFVESCRYDERLAALFSLPSDADTRVALNQLHALKYGVTRQKDRPVTVYELETYYNPLALRRLLPAKSVAALARERCPPLGICRMIAQEAYEVPYDKDLRWTSRERLELVKKINELRQCVGASERIAQTPVPLHYARHASRFLSLWCFLLPLALVDQLGLFTAPATAFIVWGLFGLREIGTLIENPFTRSLQLQIVSDTLALDIQSAVDTAALDAARKRPPPRKMPFPEAPPPPLPAPPVTGNSEPVTGHAVGEGGAAPGDSPTSSNHALG
jgi:putative membrane protein